MSVTTTNLLQGPADLYIGSFGAVEPADTAANTTPAASSWTDLGGTQDGCEVTIEREFSELEVDQIVWVPESRETKRSVTIKTNLAEVTLENLAYVMNGGTAASGSGYKAFEPDDNTAATSPTYKALIVHGHAPGTAKRRLIIVRRVLSIEAIGSSYKKDGQSFWPVTFKGHYVSSAIKPFKIIDAT